MVRSWVVTGTSVCAAAAPLTATAGTPMPMRPSPHTRRLSTCVRRPGSSSFPGANAGPYVPRGRRRKRSCVSGEPSSVSTARSRTSGMMRSIARHRTSVRSFLRARYSAEERSSPSQSEYGSLPAQYAWITWWPGGARLGSRMVGMDTAMRFPSADTSSQSLMTVWWMSMPGGSPSARMPRWRCMKLSVCRRSRQSSTKPRALALALASAGRRSGRLHCGTLHTTASRARMTVPSRKRTPVARSPDASVVTCSTCDRSASSPPCLVSPRTSASMRAPPPPRG
mmetsp:Transcript_15371/g.52148  ORF Transcript_15371/g.52148 Transcript_15371/m.52148 type:complete len:282 (-) Transcript_15371:829-1674(-)